MKKTFLISIMLVKGIVCFGQNSPTNESIISLMVNNEKYIEKKIILKGFLNLEKEDTAIYFSKDDYSNYNTKNAVYLFLSINDMNRLDIGKMSKKYVSIIGTFYIPKIKDKNMYDDYIGVLKNIESVQIIEQR